MSCKQSVKMPNMDDESFISIVQSYKELYDFSDHKYHNQARRDNIWEEIGEICEQKGLKITVLVFASF